MPTSALKTSNFIKNDQGFTLIEILVALMLAALIFLAVPSGDSAQKHRDLQTAVQNIDRSVRFAANEAVLRNTVVRLKIALDKSPVEYVVEYGPPGNLPLPDMPEEKASQSLAEEKTEKERLAKLNREFTKVEEFEEIKHELPADVEILAVAATSQKRLIKDEEASIYFFPTGEKDGALIFFSTSEELAFLEVEPFLSKTNSVFESLKSDRVARIEDIIQTRIDEVYKEWVSK